MCICTKHTPCIIFQIVRIRFHSPLLSNAAEAAEFPARRRAGGPSFRSSTNPAAFHVGQGNTDTAHMHRNSVPAVERSEDSPRDVHRPRDMARQSMPVMRNLMSRSRSRDRHTASPADEDQVRSQITCCCSHARVCVCVRVCACVVKPILLAQFSCTAISAHWSICEVKLVSVLSCANSVEKSLV